jgi:hypothetical protein
MKPIGSIPVDIVHKFETNSTANSCLIFQPARLIASKGGDDV